jgi:hypothetical protein
VAEVFARSKCVIDIQRTGQSGLTMRTFEALASGAVLVTTNEAIRNEPFYDPVRVVILPEGDPIKARALIVRALHAYTDDPGWVSRSLAPYSLSTWVQTISTRVSEVGRV